MAYLAKCPICGKTKRIDSRTQNYFKCDSCQMAIELKPNIIGKSFVMPKKEKDSTVDVEIIPDNEWDCSESMVKMGNKAFVKESFWKEYQKSKSL